MGFIQAFKGALSGTFADQWVDMYVPAAAPSTAAVIPAIQQETNAGRGSDTKASVGIITNGSKIMIPDGYALVTLQDQSVTGFISEPGGYIYQSTDTTAQSIFTGGGLVESLVKNAFERFKFGGQPGARQAALYVNIKEIPNNRFGTQAPIYWDDAFMNTQVGALVRGTYTLKIVDPITFLKGFVPASYITELRMFDFADYDNAAAEQLFNEFVTSLSSAFSSYCNDPSKGNRMSKIQGDQVGLASELSHVVEEDYGWITERGLDIIKVAIAAIEYDEDSKALLSDVRKADALAGQRGNSFMQQAVARGMQAAGENSSGEGAMNMGFMGMGLGMASGGVSGLQQPQVAVGGIQQPAAQAAPQQAAPQAAAPAEDPVTKLKQMKELLDAGVITQEEFDAAKAKFLR